MIEKYVINLKKRPDRLAKFTKKCPLKNVKTFNAINGKLLGGELDSIYPNKLNKGEKGCFLSHINLWKKQIKEDIEYFVIFEDDAIFCENFSEKFEKILNNLEKSYITYIGGRFIPDFKMKTENCCKINDFLVKEELKGKKYDGWDCDRTTQAYIIHKDCAKLLLDNIANSKIFRYRPVDHYILQVLRFYKKDIFSSYPLLCYSPLKGDSDIR